MPDTRDYYASPRPDTAEGERVPDALIDKLDAAILAFQAGRGMGFLAEYYGRENGSKAAEKAFAADLTLAVRALSPPASQAEGVSEAMIERQIAAARGCLKHVSEEVALIHKPDPVNENNLRYWIAQTDAAMAALSSPVDKGEGTAE